MAKRAIDWNRPVAYNQILKSAFHRAARVQLYKLAAALGVRVYEIRSNMGGIAVSGEAILHGEHIYIQVSQPFGGGHGILFRRCNGSRDYVGARNHFAPLDSLNDVESLAARIERETGPAYKANANEVESY